MVSIPFKVVGAFDNAGHPKESKCSKAMLICPHQMMFRVGLRRSNKASVED